MTREIGGRVLAFDHAVLEEVDLRHAGFDELRAAGCVFVRCDFRGMAFEPKFQPLFSGRPQTIFRECVFDEADLRRVDPGQARFERCSFAGANLDEWVSYCAEFVDCVFGGRIEGARFYGRPWGPDAALVDPPRPANDFRGNDFRAAELLRTAFVNGIEVLQQSWPERDDYLYLDRIHQRITRALVEIMRWRDLEARKGALAMLQATSTLYSGQREVLVRRGEPLVPTPPEVEARVWESLARVL
jgi:hypothetical protein